MADQRGEPVVLVDGHAHLHRCFRVREFLAGAASNFGRARRRLGLPDADPAVLAFADIDDQDSVERLRGAVGRETDWRLEPTAEEHSCVLRRPEDGSPLVLIAGRQITTRQGLEVLAIGTRVAPPDGEPLAETLAGVADAGALLVVPWGFGKWWFRRGRLLESLLASADRGPMFLGDNGGRPRVGRPPRSLRRAEERGVRILPGSDPLPFAGHEARAGSYGAAVTGRLDLERPAASLERLLTAEAARIRTYGEGRPLAPFLRDQIAMQLKKRVVARAT